jgi:hypothetical protein
MFRWLAWISTDGKVEKYDAVSGTYTNNEGVCGCTLDDICKRAKTGMVVLRELATKGTQFEREMQVAVAPFLVIDVQTGRRGRGGRDLRPPDFIDFENYNAAIMCAVMEVSRCR